MKDRSAPRQPIRTLRPADEPIPAAPSTDVVAPISLASTGPALSATGMPRKVLLELIDDSPYQPRLSYDPEKIDELAKGLAAVGQQEAVILREMPNGRYQLISGHRRKRAAISIGWVDIEAIVKQYSEQEAEKATLIQNEGRSDLTDYERAKMFKSAMDRGFAKTQNECAEIFSTSQGIVSRCLAMLDLPAPILELLERQPDLFGLNTSVIIRDLLKKHPDQVELISKGVERLKDGAEANSLRGWVAQMLAAEGREPVKRHHSVVASPTGATVYETRRKDTQRQIVLSVKDTDEDLEEINQWLLAALQKRREAKKA
jgi:ParB/RepB/Spo0J family partition protein